jgi:FkbM family methyltransferase
MTNTNNELKRFGTSYGGFYYPRELYGLNKDSVIYCVGAGEDISHDIELAKQLDSNVYIFDPTPRSINHVKYIKDLFDNTAEVVNDKRYGGGDVNYLSNIMNNRIDSSKVIFYDYGLYTCDGEQKFYMPSNKDYVSCSVVEGMKSNDYISVNMKTLKTIMNELGHNNVDLLKIDIEGCECDVIEQIIAQNIFPRYLAVDFDLGWTGESIRNPQKCYDTIQFLQNNNYKILHNEGPDFSFMYML